MRIEFLRDMVYKELNMSNWYWVRCERSANRLNLDEKRTRCISRCSSWLLHYLQPSTSDYTYKMRENPRNTVPSLTTWIDIEMGLAMYAVYSVLGALW